MEIDTDAMRPGMVLLEDVHGVSGKPIVPKDTKLTEVHIEIIQKFLIDKVQVSRETDSQKLNDFQHELLGEGSVLVRDPFVRAFEAVTDGYKALFTEWQANIPVQMYRVRELCLPLFEMVADQPLAQLKSLLDGRKEDLFYYKTVAMSLLSIKLAQLTNYEKKDLLQIGFAAILADIGLTKTEIVLNSDQADFRHPALSYEMIKDEATLTKQAKVAIIQHHERLDGSGFPLKIREEKIHPYAKIIAVSDRFYTLYHEHGLNWPDLFRRELTKFDPKIVRFLLDL